MLVVCDKINDEINILPAHELTLDLIMLDPRAAYTFPTITIPLHK